MQVSQKLGVGAAGLFEGIPQHGKSCLLKGAFGQRAMLVGGLSQLFDGTAVSGEPGPVDCWTSPERVADDVA
jgi:hypothetical protein